MVGGGACEFLPLRKCGGGKSFSHIEEGGGGGRNKIPLFKRGTCLEGGRHNMFCTDDFPIL